ncbi:MAG: maleylpyruvate isomerase N-terminal domain-containing protein [Acidimicrobiales bacterium]
MNGWGLPDRSRAHRGAVGTPSPCEGWTVRDVAAHLVTAFGQSLPRLMLKPAS